MDKAFLGKILKFGIVGFISFLVDFSLTYACKEWFHWDKYLANSTGVIISSLVNFMLNRIWAFGSKDKGVAKQLVLFAISNISGLFLGNGIIYLLSDMIGINFYIAKLISIGIVAVWHFSANHFIIFKK
jgi:putative flippase GtrA